MEAATQFVDTLAAAGVPARLEWYFRGEAVQEDSILRHHYAMFDVCNLPS